MSIYDQYKAPAGEGGVYLKFTEGDSVKIRLVSEPYIFYSQFTPDSPIQTKYAWSVYNHAEDKGQILQLPVTGFRKIQDLAVDDEWGDPSKYDIKITRNGTGLETVYSIVGSPNKTDLTADQLKKATELDVPEKVEGAIPLSQVVEGKTPPAPKPSATPELRSSNESSPDVVPIESRTPEPDVESPF